MERRIYKEETHSLNTLNGMLNKNNLKYAKLKFMEEFIKENIDLIKIKQAYPINDISDVEMKLDFIILSTKEFNEMKNIIDKYKNKKLKFPKLKA